MSLSVFVVSFVMDQLFIRYAKSMPVLEVHVYLIFCIGYVFLKLYTFCQYSISLMLETVAMETIMCDRLRVNMCPDCGDD